MENRDSEKGKRAVRNGKQRKRANYVDLEVKVKGSM